MKKLLALFSLVLFNKLKPFGVLEFVRSGRVAVTKPMKELSTYLKELELNIQL